MLENRFVDRDCGQIGHFNRERRTYRHVERRRRHIPIDEQPNCKCQGPYQRFDEEGASDDINANKKSRSAAKLERTPNSLRNPAERGGPPYQFPTESPRSHFTKKDPDIGCDANDGTVPKYLNPLGRPRYLRRSEEIA